MDSHPGLYFSGDIYADVEVDADGRNFIKTIYGPQLVYDVPILGFEFAGINIGHRWYQLKKPEPGKPISVPQDLYSAQLSLNESPPSPRKAYCESSDDELENPYEPSEDAKQQSASCWENPPVTNQSPPKHQNIQSNKADYNAAPYQIIQNSNQKEFIDHFAHLNLRDNTIFESDLKVCDPLNFSNLPRSITSLIVPNLKLLNDHLLHLPASITEIVAPNSVNISDAGVRHLNKLSLVTLDLAWNEDISDEGIRYMPRTLKTLILTWNEKISGKSAGFYPDGLTVLDISSVTNFDHRALGQLPRSLLVLRLDAYTEMSDFHTGFLPPNLHTLSLNSDTNLTDACIGKLPLNLTSLSLPKNESISGDAFVKLPANLTHLDLKLCSSINAKDLSSLPKSLTSLIAPSARLLEDSSINCFPKDIRLQELDFSFNTNFTNACVPRLSQHLTALNMSYSEITCASFPHLPRGLRSLILSNCSDIRSVDGLPKNLTKLDLSMAIHLNDNHISRLPRGLLHLDLSHNDLITGACIANLPPFLTWLNVSNAYLLDGSCLKHMPNSLEYLNVSSARLTVQCVKDLPKKLVKFECGSNWEAEAAFLAERSP